MKELNPFQRWMVKSNLEHAKTQGVESILAQLRANGYPNIAAAVEKEYHEQAAKTVSVPAAS